MLWRASAGVKGSPDGEGGRLRLRPAVANRRTWRAWRLLRRAPGGARLRRFLTPARLLVVSFLLLIAMGTVGLLILPGLYTGAELSFLDALFTATSAVCVTGLIVVDTATYFTVAGQAFVLLLIQLGGLGILTFATLLMLALGRRLSLHHESVATGSANVAPEVDFRRLVRGVVRFAFAAEALGAAVLFVAFLSRFPASQAAWHAIFQAVSAFCNAGFSTFSDSLVGFTGAPVVLTTVMVLIVLGGIGFITIEELRSRRGRKGRRTRLSLHSRLVLIATAVLLVGGWGTLTALEWTNTLGGMETSDRLMNGLFMSVTARTAGFNTVDYGATAHSTNFVTIVLMSIGGSPGSTAGGLKTTTAFVIGLLAVSRLLGYRTTSFRGRTIPQETIQRAIGLFVVAFAIVTAAILGYLIAPGIPPGASGSPAFLPQMFEATSAFNTVGLSMGATEDLGPSAKWLTIVLMYLGRVGPLTFAAAISLDRRRHPTEFRYATEDVMIG